MVPLAAAAVAVRFRAVPTVAVLATLRLTVGALGAVGVGVVGVVAPGSSEMPFCCSFWFQRVNSSRSVWRVMGFGRWVVPVAI